MLTDMLHSSSDLKLANYNLRNFIRVDLYFIFRIVLLNIVNIICIRFVVVYILYLVTLYSRVGFSNVINKYT